MHGTAMDGHILGVDPGLNTTGYAVVRAGPRRVEVVDAGVVRGGRGSLESRLRELHAGISEVLASYRPVAAALEELYSHYDRPRTAILMGHARGVICLAAAQAEVPVFPYAATHVKKLLTGHGRAPKAQVQAAVCGEFRLAQPPHPPDVADALAIALCHWYTQRGGALVRFA